MEQTLSNTCDCFVISFYLLFWSGWW